MKIVSYLSSIPKKAGAEDKKNLIINFNKGVIAAGDKGILHEGQNVLDCDVAMIQGWQHEVGKSSPHLVLRQKLIDRTSNKHVVTGDSNLFLYKHGINKPHVYLRYSFNGVFPNTGEYCDNITDPKRWQQISKDLDITLDPIIKKGDHIVLCCQRNGGWSMGKTPVVSWINSTINEIRKYSDRKIIIRGHPGDVKAESYLAQLDLSKYKNVLLSKLGTPLADDLKNAWTVVNHNSSSIVGPIIMGYHAIITDPKRSQCVEVASHNFSSIESPILYDREKWLHRISMFHWKFTELTDGSCWRHMREYIK